METKFKQAIRLLSMAALALLTSACSEYDMMLTEQPAENGKGIPFTATITNGGSPTRALSDPNSSNVISATWATGEHVALVYKVGDETKVTDATVTAVSDGSDDKTEGTATITAELADGVATGTDVTLIYPYSAVNTSGVNIGKVKNDVFKNQDGTIDYISANCDLRKGEGKITVNTNGASLKDKVTMDSQIAIWKLTLKKPSEDPDDPSDLDLNVTNSNPIQIKSDGRVIAATGANLQGGETNVVYLAMYPVEHKTITIKYTDDEGTYLFSKTGVSLGANTYYQSEVTLTNMRTTPLTMEALTGGTIVVRYPMNGMLYSLDGGDTKTAMSETTEIYVNAGDKVQFYWDENFNFNMSYTKIAGGSAEVKVYGNIMSLIAYDFEYAEELPCPETFVGLFGDVAADVSTPTDASGLLLPATTLSDGCYRDMFRGCQNLIAAPELPATTLKRDDEECKGCYSGMFENCPNLTAAPELPATELAEECYRRMFAGCTNLTAAPELPATELAEECYSGMFDNCGSLTAAPELPATTLVQSCYYEMFKDCHNLSSVTCLATEINATDCTQDWLSGAGNSVSETKTFITPSATNWSSGNSGIPNGWTRVEP